MAAAWAESAPPAACRAAKRIAARLVESHRRDETDARGAIAIAKPRSASPRRSLSRARTNRLRSVPLGHFSRAAASSGESPSK